jgi:hypothetical protein
MGVVETICVWGTRHLHGLKLAVHENVENFGFEIFTRVGTIFNPCFSYVMLTP